MGDPAVASWVIRKRATLSLTGQTPPLADVLKYYDTLEPIPLGTSNTGARHEQLPLGRDVVTFPAVNGGG